jgi:Helix-turn-helix domain
MEDSNENLTIKDVAKLLRCSQTQVQRALRGKVAGMPALTHLSVGRRKIVRRQWLNHWMERNKAS